MAADERNFRSTYYEKVGFRSVEEKKSLEILLKDRPLDQGKLKQFCLRFTVPAVHRNFVWKLLLGVIPVHVECHSFVMEQRKQEYQDLYRALNVMKVVDSNTPKSQIFLAMWVLQMGYRLQEINIFIKKGFIPIVQEFNSFFDDDTDIYWLTKRFYDNILKFEADIPKLVERSYILLEKEDEIYFNRLKENGILEKLPLIRWFGCCFAGVLHENALAKIWDKLCGGSYKILVYVIVVILTTLKHTLLSCSVLDALLCIKNISEENADMIANKSIDMWQHYGSPLTMYDISQSKKNNISL